MSCHGDDNDIVLDILARVRVIHPDLTEDQARKIEKDVRHHWGGERIHICKDMKRKPHERDRIREKVKRDGVKKTLKSESGISRATLYRMIREKDEGEC